MAPLIHTRSRHRKTDYQIGEPFLFTSLDFGEDVDQNIINKYLFPFKLETPIHFYNEDETSSAIEEKTVELIDEQECKQFIFVLSSIINHERDNWKNELYSNYRIHNLGVFEFLKSNRFLLHLVLEAPKYIRKFFENPELSIELDINPENTEYSEKLVVSIETNLEPEEALINLREFDEHWWRNYLSESKGILRITLDYV